MRNHFSISPEEGFDEILHRYEESTLNDHAEYFDVDELEVIIDYYLQKGRQNDSLKAIELGLKLHPNSTPIRARKAKLDISKGKYKEALKIIEEINEIETFDIDNLLLQGEILVKLKRHKEAELVFEKALNSEFEAKDQLCLDIAFIFLNEMLYDYSLKYLLRGNKINPQNLDLLYELAFNYKQKEKADEAIDVYNKIIDLEPYSSEAWFNLGQLFFVKEDYEKAIQAFDFATTIDDKDSMAWLQKGHAYFQNESYTKAIEAYSKYMEQTSYKDIPLVYIGECYEKLENYEKAMECYLKVIKEDDQNTDAL